MDGLSYAYYHLPGSHCKFRDLETSRLCPSFLQNKEYGISMGETEDKLAYGKKKHFKLDMHFCDGYVRVPPNTRRIIIKRLSCCALRSIIDFFIRLPTGCLQPVAEGIPLWAIFWDT